MTVSHAHTRGNLWANVWLCGPVVGMCHSHGLLECWANVCTCCQGFQFLLAHSITFGGKITSAFTRQAMFKML